MDSAQALAQAALDLATTADQGAYNVATTSDFASAMAANAASDDTPLANYWSAVAAAAAAQAVSDAKAQNDYETTVTGADVQLSDDNQTADETYAEAQRLFNLNVTTEAAGFVDTQADTDAGYIHDEAIAEANARSTGDQDAAEVHAAYDHTVEQAENDNISAQFTAAMTELGDDQAGGYTTYVANHVTESDAFWGAMVTMMGAQADASVTESKDLYTDADLTRTTDIEADRVGLAQNLADDANNEATDEQATAIPAQPKNGLK